MAPSTFILSAARLRQDESRRVSLLKTRLTSSWLYDSDEEQEAERLREQEEELALSECFGETAENDEGNNRKRREESEIDIARELDQEEKWKSKKLRPQLVPAGLKDDNGLIKLLIEMKRINYKPKKKRDVMATGAYCKEVVKMYRSFCDDLMPSANFEDILLKVEQLGIKKEGRQFLQNMRDDIRTDYLEILYGREKAEKLLQDLKDGMETVSCRSFFVDGSRQREAGSTCYSGEVTLGASISTNSPATDINSKPTSDMAEKEATFEEGLVEKNDAVSKTVPSKLNSVYKRVELEMQKSPADNDWVGDDKEEVAFEDIGRVKTSRTDGDVEEEASSQDYASDGFTHREKGLAAFTVDKLKGPQLPRREKTSVKTDYRE